MKSVPWLITAALALLALAFAALLPACALLLACATILRAKRRTNGNNGRSLPRPWSGARSAFFRGTVFHVRHRPAVHAFRYPLHFAVVDLDEAPALFGSAHVRPDEERKRSSDDAKAKGSLWPLSSLMSLRDEDHLKNGEGLPEATVEDARKGASMRERVEHLIRERTDGKVDLRAGMERRRILLVTHLMYYGYCFNPVSFYFVLKPKAYAAEGDDEGEEIEAVVVEISNTPWNEMRVYVLHPDSVDTVRHSVDPSDDSSGLQPKTYRYRMLKKFHVSPFMTMDFTYDWKFLVSRDRIQAESRSVKQTHTPGKEHGGSQSNGGAKEDGALHFVAGFDIRRSGAPTAAFPLQLARVISRFPIYCFVVQLWIHYEAARLLTKGVAFVPHPEGSETRASRAIAAAMRPAFAAMDAADAWWSRGKGKRA